MASGHAHSSAGCSATLGASHQTSFHLNRRLASHYDYLTHQLAVLIRPRLTIAISSQDQGAHGLVRTPCEVEVLGRWPPCSAMIAAQEVSHPILEDLYCSIIRIRVKLDMARSRAGPVSFGCTVARSWRGTDCTHRATCSVPLRDRAVLLLGHCCLVKRSGC